MRREFKAERCHGSLVRGSLLMLLLSGPAACSAPDLGLFGNAGGAGGGATGSASASSASASSASASSASASSASASSASASASASGSASSGGPVCGNKICEPPTETPVFCPQDCPGGSNSAGSSSSSGGGMCNHPACDTGDALDPACDPCAGTVCASDPFCCTDNWDGQCVNEADQQCGACCGNAACNNTEDCNSCAQDCPGPCQPPPTCAHSVCFVDVALDPMQCRNPCVDKVCAQDPSCCMGPWEDKCGILAANCGPDPCVTAVCAAMPSCCSSMWSQACVDQAKMSCNTQCNCQHSICQGGGALADTCNPCVTELCKADSYCCTTAWDNICVGEVESICGIICN